MVLRSKRPTRIVEGFQSECNPARKRDESSQEDCLPFFLDDDSSGPEGSPGLRRSSVKSTYGFSLDTKVDRHEGSPTTSRNIDRTLRYSTARQKESVSLRSDSHKSSYRSVNDPLKPMVQKPGNARSRGTKNLSCFFTLVLPLNLEYLLEQGLFIYICH